MILGISGLVAPWLTCIERLSETLMHRPEKIPQFVENFFGRLQQVPDVFPQCKSGSLFKDFPKVSWLVRKIKLKNYPKNKIQLMTCQVCHFWQAIILAGIVLKMSILF